MEKSEKDNGRPEDERNAGTHRLSDFPKLNE
jgi:hypothetical protein